MSYPGARFVEPVAPVQALQSTSTPESEDSPGHASEDSTVGELKVESLTSPTKGLGQHMGDGDIRVGVGHQRRHTDPSVQAFPRDEAGCANGTSRTRRLSSLKKFALPAFRSSHEKATSATSLAKLDVLDLSQVANLQQNHLLDSRCRHVDTTVSVKFQPEALKSSKSVTITSTRHVTPPAAQREVYSKSSWDIVLGRDPESCVNGARRLSLTAPVTLYRSGSNPDALPGRLEQSDDAQDAPRREDVFYTEKEKLRTARKSEPSLAEHLVRFAYPEKAKTKESVLVKDASAQVSGPAAVQLYVLPPHRCACVPRIHLCTWIMQVIFSLVGLGAVILVIALGGAAAFHATEGPHEEEQARQLAKQQSELVVRLATELRQVVAEDAVWRTTISRYVERHEGLVVQAAAAGYGEGGAGEGGARIWTYPGGLLFAASLLTTLGFGAPVPRTTMGRLAAGLLALVGIPLNIILALQLGRLLCTRLPRVLPLLLPSQTRPSLCAPKVFPATGAPAAGGAAASPTKPGACSCAPCWPSPSRDTSGCCGPSGIHWTPLLVPAGSLLLYYVLGMILFGSVLALPVSEWLLFPLSLTAVGGVARVPGWVRVLYAAYLEGGVLLAAVAVALLQGPTTSATTDLAMKLGILNMDDFYNA